MVKIKDSDKRISSRIICKIAAWQRVLGLVYIEPGLNCTLSREKLKITYSHYSRLVNDLIYAGLIEFKVMGRSKALTVTEEGKGLAKVCFDLQKEMLKVELPSESQPSNGV